MTEWIGQKATNDDDAFHTAVTAADERGTEAVPLDQSAEQDTLLQSEAARLDFGFLPVIGKRGSGRLAKDDGRIADLVGHQSQFSDAAR